MNKYFTYAWWALEIALLYACLGFEWALGFAILSLIIEMIYFIINKYFGSLIKSFGASWLRTVVFEIHDYKRFWFNFAMRVAMYLVGFGFTSFCVSLLS